MSESSVCLGPVFYEHDRSADGLWVSASTQLVVYISIKLRNYPPHAHTYMYTFITEQVYSGKDTRKRLLLHGANGIP